MTDTPWSTQPYLKEMMDVTDKGNTREIVIMKGCTPDYVRGLAGLMTHDTEDGDAFSERVKKRYIKSNDTTDELANDTEEIEELDSHIPRCSLCGEEVKIDKGVGVCMNCFCVSSVDEP